MGGALKWIAKKAKAKRAPATITTVTSETTDYPDGMRVTMRTGHTTLAVNPNRAQMPPDQPMLLRGAVQSRDAVLDRGVFVSPEWVRQQQALLFNVAPNSRSAIVIEPETIEVQAKETKPRKRLK